MPVPYPMGPPQPAFWPADAVFVAGVPELIINQVPPPQTPPRSATALPLLCHLLCHCPLPDRRLRHRLLHGHPLLCRQLHRPLNTSLS